MKRFLNYILILVVLVGVFSPIFSISAQSTGKCFDSNNNPTDLTYDQCKLNIIPGSNNNYTWSPTGQAPGPSTNPNTGPVTITTGQANDGKLMPNSTLASGGTGSCDVWNLTGTIGGCIAAALSKIAFVLMKIASLLVGLGGYLLNTVINQTILNMSSNIKAMTGINIAWKIIRDLMNIAFIFLLVYYGIKLILSQENTGNIQKFIFGIVLASLLINFSLFFTKVIIDSSNIVTIGIYDVISGKSNSPSDENTGISNQIMKALGLQSAWNAPLDLGVQDTDNNYSFLAGNLMATILFLITAFVFLAVSVMFIVRYIVLIYLMALSPIAYMGMALPGLQKNAQEWWKTFMGQIIFAPLFMIMMLVTLKLMSANFSGANTTALQSASGLKDTIDVIFKFSLVIGFTLASLVISKKYSTQGSDYVKKMGNWATSTATGYALSGAASIQRNTIGRAGQAIANNQTLREMAPDSRLARMALTAGSKTGSSSFDVRSTRFGKGIGAGKGGGKGGYQAEREDKIKKRMEFAERNIQDTVTGADVEAQMLNVRDATGMDYTKASNERRVANLVAAGETVENATKDVAQEVERVRLREQQALIQQADANTSRRRERYLHNLSQTRWYTPNSYSGVSEDAEAARRMREGKKAKKSGKDKILADLAEVLKDEAGDTPPSPPETPPTPTPPTP